METINLGAGDDLAPIEWDDVVAKLDSGEAPPPDGLNSRTTWLATINDDGSPHVTAVGAIRVDGAWWFQTGAGTRKHRNLDRDPRCSISVSTNGADVVVEGVATRVSDPDTLRQVVQTWVDSGWPVEPDPGGEGITAPFNAPAQGPPPWHVYRLDARSAYAVLTAGGGGLTRFVF